MGNAVRKTAQLTSGDSSLGAGSTTPSRDDNKEGTHSPSGGWRGPPGSKKTKAALLS